MTKSYRQDFYGRTRAKLYGRPSVYPAEKIPGQTAALHEWVARRRLKAHQRRGGIIVVALETDPPPSDPNRDAVSQFIPLKRAQAERLALWILKRTGWKPA